MGQSSVKDVDDAFQLLLLIVGIVFSIFNSHPEALLSSGGDPEFLIQILIRITVIPLLVVTFLWIGAKLIQNVNYAIFLKLIDWMMAINLTWGVLYLFFREMGYFQRARYLETYLGIIIAPLVPIFVYYVVVPRYKEMYPNASFFEKKWRFVLAFLLSTLLFFLTLYFATASLN